ncbi:MAG: hypothetical protein IJX51_00980 [Clostridia bacterium]|nr:hypothetical protein [Clostridia bacterium]
MFTWWICVLVGVFVGSLTYYLLHKDLIKQFESLKKEYERLNDVNKELHDEFLQTIKSDENKKNNKENEVKNDE